MSNAPDIVDDLRGLQFWLRQMDSGSGDADKIQSAADTIEALRAENARLRKALERIAGMKPHHAGQTFNEFHMQKIACAALTEKEGTGRD